MKAILGVALLLATGPVAGDEPARRAPDPMALPGDLLWMIGPRDGAPHKAKPQPSKRLLARGRDLFVTACSVCHGETGDGLGEFANRLRPRPTDFQRGVYKLRSTPSGTLPTDEDLFGTITRGMHGTAMHRWPQMTEGDRWALVFHLKTLSPRFAREKPGRSIGVPIAPRESESLRDHGELLYVRLGCGACHGPSGEGDGLTAARLPLARVRDFTRGRFIRGAEMEDIYVTLRVGVEGTPMFPYDRLENDEIWALASYVRGLIRQRPLHELPPAGNQAAGDLAAPSRSMR
jgi:mono/diheme cytochrome c family protein